MFLDLEKRKKFPVFVIIYLVSYLTLILHSCCLFVSLRPDEEIYRRLLNEIPFSIFIWRHQSRIGLSRKLLSENTFHN